MAGLISSMEPGFGGSIMIDMPKPITWNIDRPRKPETISHIPLINGTEGYEEAKKYFAFENQFRMETKPKYTFQKQQDKILTFIPPMRNDVYTLDVANIDVGKNIKYDKVPLKHDQYVNLRNANLIDKRINPIINKTSSYEYQKRPSEISHDIKYRYTPYNTRKELSFQVKEQKNFDHVDYFQRKNLPLHVPKALTTIDLKQHPIPNNISLDAQASNHTVFPSIPKSFSINTNDYAQAKMNEISKL